VHKLDQSSQKLFTFSSGGWVILVTLLISTALFIWAVAPAIFRMSYRPPGDGKNIESFGFDVLQLTVSRDLVRPAMLHRDMVPVMFDASASEPSETENHEDRWEAMQRRNDPKYGKYLVPSDKIIGVELNGEARAYPMHVIYVHDIINDTLAGTPIAVTYNWLTDSVVVFDRRVAQDTQPLEFGHSGLVYNSNMLIYDRAPSQTNNAEFDVLPAASLWSQLLAKPISGPAAAQELSLRILPAQLVTWRDWSERHPKTSVLNRDLRMASRYKDAAPLAYFKSPDLLKTAVVRPLPPTNSPPLKARMLAVSVGDQHKLYEIADLISRCDSQGRFADAIGSITVNFRCDRQLQTVYVENDEPDDDVIVIPAYWFAWHAMHPEDAIHRFTEQQDDPQ
jgi:hypothetical protein